jgi:hypothetical protein
MLKTNTALDSTLISALKPNSEKRVTLVCDDCGKETATSYANYTKVVRPDGKTRCRKCACIKSGLARRGKKLLGGPRPKVWGNKHHSWKGGRFIASDGYVKVHLGSPRKYRKEHFLVVEEFLGRTLRPTEVVHHIDGDKLNNTLINLVLLSSESEHQRVHNSLYNLSKLLVRAGLIVFNRESGTYMAVGKLRELLEQPEAANQQPSLESNLFEGSTTRNSSQEEQVSTSA